MTTSSNTQNTQKIQQILLKPDKSIILVDSKIVLYSLMNRENLEKEIIDLIDIPFDYIATAVGTGGTLAGISVGLKPHQKAIGVSALKNGAFLTEDVKQLIGDYKKLFNEETTIPNFEILTNYHFGGYTKTTKELLKFKADFEALNNFVLDYIYTSKLFFALTDLYKIKGFPNNATVIALHTGGLQGNAGFEKNKNADFTIS
jgi:1-aminocyclopropane-1-carboxylate deaminase/D-cysteine desulfhydrase-like pyridoxal-dependent ACC family enzyme